jgi:hypothetical protein
MKVEKLCYIDTWVTSFWVFNKNKVLHLLQQTLDLAWNGRQGQTL